MDPDVALAQIRLLASEILTADEKPGVRTKAELLSLVGSAVELAEACEALDQWLCGSGFLPAAWQVK